jgi:hypothetical protein
MSAALQHSPGDRVKARLATPMRTREETITLADGSIVICREDLTTFGAGDPIRGAREIRLMIANERERAINETPTPRSASASVRIATAADEDAIYALLRLDVAENAEVVAPANEACIRETIKAALTPPSVVGVIDGPNGTPVAVVMLMITRWWWSKAWYFQEIPLFVHPDHRKSSHAKSLVAFQTWWTEEISRGQGYRVYLLCGVLGTKRVQAKIQMYRRKFRCAGAAFLHPWPYVKAS